MKTINDFNSYKIKLSLFIDIEIEQEHHHCREYRAELHWLICNGLHIDQKEEELIK